MALPVRPGQSLKPRRKPGDPSNRTARMLQLRVVFDFDPTASADVRREHMIGEVMAMLRRGMSQGQTSTVCIMEVEPARIFNPRGMYTVRRDDQ